MRESDPQTPNSDKRRSGERKVAYTASKSKILDRVPNALREAYTSSNRRILDRVPPRTKNCAYYTYYKKQIATKPEIPKALPRDPRRRWK